MNANYTFTNLAAIPISIRSTRRALISSHRGLNLQCITQITGAYVNISHHCPKEMTMERFETRNEKLWWSKFVLQPRKPRSVFREKRMIGWPNPMGPGTCQWLRLPGSLLCVISRTPKIDITWSRLMWIRNADREPRSRTDSRRKCGSGTFSEIGIGNGLNRSLCWWLGTSGFLFFFFLESMSLILKQSDDSAGGFLPSIFPFAPCAHVPGLVKDTERFNHYAYLAGTVEIS